MPNCHLVILKESYIKAILQGRKTIESRFYKTRKIPFDNIAAGDILFLKPVSGLVSATAIACKVTQFSNLTAADMLNLKKKYNKYICADDSYWQAKANSKYACLIHLASAKKIIPARINKKDRRAWVMLTKKENFNLT